MDISLAGAWDGITSAGHLRAQYDLPVVFLTAHVDRETLARAKAVEPFGFLTKPVQETNLPAAIETTLARHALTQRLRESEARYHIVADHTSTWKY